MTIAGTSDLIERLITQTMLDAAESIASAQRGKEAAEKERDRLASRLDAAEKLLREFSETRRLVDGYMREKAKKFLSSSPSTSAVAEAGRLKMQQAINKRFP